MNPKLRLSSMTVGLMLAAFLAISVARAPAASAGALQQTDAPLDGPHVLITGNINVRGG